jgi:uroporphyrinogen decarboxylase
MSKREKITMTPRQRIQAAVNHEEIGSCPYLMWMDEDLQQRLGRFTGNPDFGKELETFMTWVGPAYPETNERVDDTHYVDAFGVVWEEATPGEIGMANAPQYLEPNFEGYTFPPTRIPGLFDNTPAQLEQHSDLYTMWSLGFSLYERAWSLRGMEPFLMDMACEPAFAHELMDRICEVNLDLIAQACEHPLDCIRFGDDWGAQRGLIMGPHFWREYIKPRMTKMIELSHRHGKTVFLHSDGDIREIIPDLVEIGLDILNPVQPDVMNIYDIKREFGKDLTFLGGVSVQHLLPHCSAEEVRAEIRRMIREIGAGGGFIISPTHTLGPDIPLENLAVMVEELLHQH